PCHALGHGRPPAVSICPAARRGMLSAHARSRSLVDRLRGARRRGRARGGPRASARAASRDASSGGGGRGGGALGLPLDAAGLRPDLSGGPRRARRSGQAPSRVRRGHGGPAALPPGWRAMKGSRTVLALLALGCVAPAADASETTLPLDAQASSLTFTIRRPGETIEGTARRFEGEVTFDPR